MIIQSLLASIASGGGTPPPPPQASGLYAWEWDSDNLATNRITNTSYNGAGSSGYSSGIVNMSLSSGWNTTTTPWPSGNTGVQIWPANSNSFMSTSDFLLSPYSSSWASNTRTGLTIELWFYPTAGARTLVSEHGVGGPGSAGWRDDIIELNSNGTVVADIWPYTGGPITTGNSVNYNAWNHVIYTYNVSTTTLSLQLNGGTVVSNSSKNWECAVDGGGGLYYAIGYADQTSLSSGANITNFDGRWGKVRIANYPMTSNRASDWAKYNSFSIVDSGTSLGTSWTVEIVGEFYPSQYWATLWGNEVWNSSTGHIAYLTGPTSLNVGKPNSESQYNLADSISTRAYWVFTHTDGGGIDVYRNGVLLTPTGSNYIQPSVANNTLLFGARHGNDGTGTSDSCPGNYLYTNITASALAPATISSNYTTLQATYSLP